MSSILETPIEYIKGVGPQRAELLRTELAIFTFGDLMVHYPFRYIDRSTFHHIAEINAETNFVQLKGKFLRVETFGDKRNKRLVASFSDGTGNIELVWFQGVKWLEGKFKAGIDYIVFGKPTEYKGKVNIVHPEVDLYSDESTASYKGLVPVYSSTEKLKAKGLDSKGLLKIVQNVLQQTQGKIPETLSSQVMDQYALISRETALSQIHFPVNSESLKKAIVRLKFEELFFVQLRLLRNKELRQKVGEGFVFAKIGDFFNTFYNQYLPFELTNAQKRVIKEIRLDVGGGKQMNRLVQGDVGSGKTMVALMAILMAIDNGYQSCLMAPTEILATQHFETIQQLVRGLHVEVALLTGSTKTKERRRIHEMLVSGDLKLIIGTHALLEDQVVFKNLGLAVIDEQHRFGVAQRARLHAKNTLGPHVLIMTATPIPRTLAMTLYGDLDTSIIDELPPGRKPIKTLHLTDNQRLRMFGFVREQIALGRQVYVVYPLIEESEKMDLKNLQEGFESMEKEFPLPNYRISILHGKMNSERKDFEMSRFIKGETNIMVATTVIEVGVNVPNASVMVIENAERFGLSQLHQLRGRVGRGADQSFCILMTSYKISRESKLRMETMVRTNDGFEISEVDLQLRGPGDIQGTQQSGLLNLKIADLAKDQQLLQHARNAAQLVLSEDPELKNADNATMHEQLVSIEKSQTNWSRIA